MHKTSFRCKHSASSVCILHQVPGLVCRVVIRSNFILIRLEYFTLLSLVVVVIGSRRSVRSRSERAARVSVQTGIE